MTKRLSAKVGEYKKDGDTKGEYVQIGVILNNDNGEFLLLDPTVNLAGVLAKQNALEFKKGGQMRDNVMCGIYEENNQSQGGYQQQGQQQGGFQNQGQQGGYQQAKQGGFNQQ